LRKELERLMAINQGLMMSNEAYARQISELKKAIDSMKLLETSPSSRLANDVLFDLDRLGLEYGFTESIPSAQCSQQSAACLARL
jgi:hypothetical protein